MLRATTACTFSTSQLPKLVRTCGVFTILTWKCASRHVHFSTSRLPKVVRTCGAFTIFTWKCASRHNGVHFFDISTSKSGPRMACFVHFDLEMCFAPQRRALFHLSSGQLAPLRPEVTFRPSGAPNHWKKHSESRLSYLFAHLHLLSSDFLPL